MPITYTSSTSSSTAPAVIIKQAALQYQKQLLFTDLNLELVAGKCTCILGPSGVGKSSLLRLIAGLTNGNEMTPNNFSLQASDDQPLSQRIAYMAQQDLLLPWLSVLDNVLIGYRLRGKIQKTHIQQAKELLNQVELSQAIHLKPVQLSGGMRQRVALARTLMESKPIVLMDEPFNALDIVTKLRLQELSTQLLTGRTTLLITHDPLEALRLADYIYLMSGKPASLSSAIIPTGEKPRDITNTQLLNLQASIIEQLTAAERKVIC